MPSPLPQDTPFAELRYAVQAGANEITWQKRTPISNNERNHAMRLKKLFAYTLPIPLLLTILVYFAYRVVIWLLQHHRSTFYNMAYQTLQPRIGFAHKHATARNLLCAL